MLTLKSISKSFYTTDVETRALSEVSLNVQDGEFVAITGPSGSGKTTLLNIIGLLEDFDSGEYLLSDLDVSNMGDRKRSEIRLRNLGFIFQGFNLLPELNVCANIELPLRLRQIKKSKRKAMVEESLELVGLQSRLKHYPYQLSGGQQQRVAVARALCGKPKVILADEPTGNLDSEMSDEIFGLLKDINSNGTTIVMVTHEREHAEKAERCIEVKDGKVIGDSLIKGNGATYSGAQNSKAADTV